MERELDGLPLRVEVKALARHDVQITVTVEVSDRTGLDVVLVKQLNLEFERGPGKRLKNKKKDGNKEFHWVKDKN